MTNNGARAAVLMLVCFVSLATSISAQSFSEEYLVGRWDQQSRVVLFRPGQLDVVLGGTRAGDYITFQDDKSGEFVRSAGTPFEFTWEAQPEPDGQAGVVRLRVKVPQGTRDWVLLFVVVDECRMTEVIISIDGVVMPGAVPKPSGMEEMEVQQLVRAMCGAN